MSNIAVPEGFLFHVRNGASYVQTLGDLYGGELSNGLWVIGLRVSPHHCDRLNIPHGGKLATLADTALGVTLHLARHSSTTMVTVNLSLDYLAPAKVGE